MPTTSPLGTHAVPSNRTRHSSSYPRITRLWRNAAVFANVIPGLSFPAVAQVNGVGSRPYQGWSTFSELTISNNFMNEQAVLAQSDALHR